MFADCGFASGVEQAAYTPLCYFVQEGYNVALLTNEPLENSSHASDINAYENKFHVSRIANQCKTK